jgi:predicted GTPase
VDELKTKTVNQIIQEVDKYYQENPGKLNTSVIEAILRRLTSLCPPETAGEKKK